MSSIKSYYKNISLLTNKWLVRLKEDRNALVFLVFLFISTGFWILNALQKSYTTTINYPIRFTNIPDGQILKDEKKGELELKVEAGGFIILRYILSNSFLAHDFPIADMQPLKTSDKTGVYLLTANYYRDINGKLDNGMELLEISPDTLFVELMQRKTKKVPVVANLEMVFEQQHFQAGNIKIEPDSISISGEESLVDTITQVRTRFTSFSELKDTLVRNLSLEEIDGIDFSRKRVVITVPVEPFTESTMSIPVVALNLSDSLYLKAFPPEVTVSFRVALSQFETISASDFLATVDLSNQQEISNQRLKVKLEKYPDGLYSVDYSPLFIEYLLEKVD
jgi:hypothetical protein